jgi:hypothetical protein
MNGGGHQTPKPEMVKTYLETCEEFHHHLAIGGLSERLHDFGEVFDRNRPHFRLRTVSGH